MRPKTYLTLFAVLALAGFSCIAVFNYIVDPYRFYNSPDLPGINEFRQRFFYGQYISKPYALRERAPEAVILGVSRAGSSLATDHPGWEDTNIYNYAMAGSTAYLLWRNYQHAKASGDLKKVLLMLDFYMFNIYQEKHVATSYIQGYEERLSVTPDYRKNLGYPIRLFKDLLTTLISFEISFESWKTIVAQSRIADKTLYKATLTPTGFWINDPTPEKTQRWMFHHVEKQYMTITWYPLPEKKFSLRREDGTSNMIYLRNILADAHRDGVDLRVGFMPFHARLGEALHAVGLWDDFEQWKTDVVRVVEEEAAKAGKAPFPLWDFTGYNSITTERVPLNEDITTRMKWHLDPTHVSRATGDLIQNIMLETDGARFEDFGQRVTSGNIQSYIERTRADRTRYVEEHPEDVQEVIKRAAKTASWRKEAG